VNDYCTKLLIFRAAEICDEWTPDTTEDEEVEAVAKRKEFDQIGPQLGRVRPIFKSFPPPGVSKRKEFDQADPFLRFTRGPDKKQAFDNRRHSGALVNEKQTAHGLSRT
jgi:hypothetical protein